MKTLRMDFAKMPSTGYIILSAKTNYWEIDDEIKPSNVR